MANKLKIRNLFFYFIAFGFFMFSAKVSNAQQISLIDIITVQANNQPKATVVADKMGGTIAFERTYQTGCTGKYYMQWKFSKDITTLKKGEKFSVTLTCLNCSTPCGFRKTSAFAGGANNIIKPVGKYNFTYNSNITVTKSTGTIHPWNPADKSHTSELTAHMSKSVPNTAFYITMGSHFIYYVFSAGAAPSTAINCHTLLGLGKLIGSLELGAREGYGASWMVATIDFALNHINATNCLSSTYLLDLKRRIASATNTRVFENEIHNYSVSLETETTTSCPACGSCN